MSTAHVQDVSGPQNNTLSIEPAPSAAAPSMMAEAMGRHGAALVQRKLQRRRQRGGADAAASVQAAADTGLQGASGPLPHAETIQAAFGRHDVSHLQAHTGGAAAQACEAIGATAYASGDRVAFAGTPDLHTAAHEAAHTVQQRAGVQLRGGVGEAGDAYEQHADRVADAVVAGRSAEGLLDASPGSGAASGAVQRQEAPDPAAASSTPAAPDQIAFNPEGEWTGEDVLVTLKARVTVPPALEPAIRAGAKATALFCAHFADVVRESEMSATKPEDKEKYSDMGRRVFSSMVRLSYPKTMTVTYQHLVDLAQAHHQVGQSFRDQVLASAQGHVGPGAKPVLSKAQLGNDPNHTSCIDFAGNMATEATPKGEVGVGAWWQGPNAFAEINPAVTDRHLPDGAWHPLWAGNTYQPVSERPHAGDYLIIGKSTSQTQHISVFQSVERLPDGKENWKSLGGGKEPLGQDGTRQPAAAGEETNPFDPETGRVIHGGQNMYLRGWVDTAALYRGAQASAKKP